MLVASNHISGVSVDGVYIVPTKAVRVVMTSAAAAPEIVDSETERGGPPLCLEVDIGAVIIGGYANIRDKKALINNSSLANKALIVHPMVQHCNMAKASHSAVKLRCYLIAGLFFSAALSSCSAHPSKGFHVVLWVTCFLISLLIGGGLLST